MTRMVKTCSAKCPICQRLITDSDAETLVARVKRHAILKHNTSISDIEIEDLSCVIKVFGNADQEALRSEQSIKKRLEKR